MVNAYKSGLGKAIDQVVTTVVQLTTSKWKKTLQIWAYYPSDIHQFGLRQLCISPSQEYQISGSILLSQRTNQYAPSHPHTSLGKAWLRWNVETSSDVPFTNDPFTNAIMEGKHSSDERDEDWFTIALVHYIRLGLVPHVASG